MEQSRPQPTQDEWLQHKATIRRLYIVDKMPLKQLLGEMAKMGLQATKAQLEYKLKQWAFRRNIDKDTWIIIDRRITKRKREGKDTEVIHCGKRLKPSTVEKETNRHRHKTIFAQLGPAPSPPPTSAIDQQVMVCTPQSLPMEFTWPTTLPWFYFQSEYSRFFASRPSTSDLNVGISETVQLTQASRTRFLLSEIVALDSELGSMPLGQQPTVSRLAAIIGKSMPESFPEEHLHSAQLLLAGSSEESLHEGWKMLIYNLSNDLTDLREAMVWNTTMQMLEEHRIFNLQVDLRNPQDKTIQGLMDTLFSAAIHWTTNNYSNNKINYDKALNLVKWLLSSGYDANSRSYYQVRAVGTQVPLMAAVLSGNVDLMQHLLDKGADANLTSLLQGGGGDEYCDEHWGLPMHPVTVAMMPGWVADWVDRINPEISLRMVKILLRYTNTANLTRAFHISISQGKLQLAMELFQQGANPATVLRHLRNDDRISFQYEDTALSLAIAVGNEATQLVLDVLKSQYTAQQMGSFVTTDVFVAAAFKGDDNTVRFLHSINPVAATSANQRGFTPLHAAAHQGHLSTCELLIELQGSEMYRSTTWLSPLHLATVRAHKEIVRLLIEKGCDVNVVAILDDTYEEFKWQLVVCGSPNDILESFEPLDLVVEKVESSPSDASDLLDCAAMLAQAGARLTGEEAILAARFCHINLLSAALSAGVDPNFTDYTGTSVLQTALAAGGLRNSDPSALHAVATLLVDKGARLLGGEVVLAILQGDWALAKILTHGTETLADTDPNGMTALEAQILSPKKDHLLLANGMRIFEYNAGALCAAVMTRDYSITEQLLAFRPLHLQADILETTAVGLAAETGDLVLLRKLLAYLPVSNVALLPLYASWEEPWWIKLCRIHQRCFWRCNNSKHFKGSALALPVARGNTAAVSELLRSGYEPDIFTWTVIACRNNLEMVKLLIENNKRPPSIFTNFPVWSSPDDSCHPLIGAMQTGNKELLLLLLDASPKIHQHKEENPPFPTLLQCAVQRGYLDAVEYLIKAGADVNEYNLYISGSRSPVQFAVELGRLDILDYLVKAGADINQHRQQDEECLTPLQCAVQLGRLDIVKYLVEAKADIDEHNLQIWGSQSPLQCAVEEGHLDIFHCLVEAGANVNSPPALERGGTALQFAAIKGHLGLARKLLGLGAHVDAPGSNENGRTALEGAAEQGRLDMVQLLLCHGALTTGPGRRQYIRAIKLATGEGKNAVAKLLRDFREWSEEDEDMMMEESLPKDILSLGSSVWAQKPEVDKLCVKDVRVEYTKASQRYCY